MRLQIVLHGVAEKIFLGMGHEVFGREANSKENRDLVEDALALLSFAIEETVEGRKVGSYDPKREQFREITFPTLRALSQSRAAQAHRAELERA